MKITFQKNLTGKSTDTASVKVARQVNDDLISEVDGSKIIVLGVEKPNEMTRRKLILLIRKAISLAKENRLSKISMDLDSLNFKSVGAGVEELAELLGTNAEMANYDFTEFKSTPKEGWRRVRELIIVGNNSTEAKRGVARGQVLGEEVNKCRTLANTPGGMMTPTILARAAKETASGQKMHVQALGQKELVKLKAGAILGVAQGSKEEPKLIVMSYDGGKKGEKPIVLIGKGVTFDTGGLNLKTADGILGMHLDMSGGAAVIHAIAACARLGMKKNIVAVIPAVENSPSGESYRPGDILKSMSGKTIQVLNTDAEGRVILADAITYSKRFNPRLVVDVATLTGAALVALGQRASAILTRDEKLQKLTQELGEKSGDYVWPLPLWEEYEAEVEGSFGDVTNIHNKLARHGGTINGGIFLLQFAKELKCPWMHIDMASRMETTDDEYLSKGAAGAPVRLLVALVEKY